MPSAVATSSKRIRSGPQINSSTRGGSQRSCISLEERRVPVRPETGTSEVAPARSLAVDRRRKPGAQLRRLGEGSPDPFGGVRKQSDESHAASSTRPPAQGAPRRWVAASVMRVLFSDDRCISGLAARWLVEGRPGSQPTSCGRARASGRARGGVLCRTRYSRRWASTRTSTSPASRNTRRCLETDGWLNDRAVTSAPDRLLRNRGAGRGSRAGVARPEHLDGRDS